MKEVVLQEYGVALLRCAQVCNVSNVTAFIYFASAVMCPSLTAPSNGSISYAEDMTADFEFMTTVTYSCNSGFALLEGDSMRECLGKNEWSGSPPLCHG